MQIKTLIIGNAGAGKSCWMSRFVEDVFPESVEPTIGLNYKSRTIGPDQFQIWDFSGVERFRRIFKSYYQMADCIVMICDLTIPMAEWELNRWFEEVHQNTISGIPVFLVANKADSPQLKEENLKILGEGFSSSLENVPNNRCFITSAKTGAGIQECTQKIHDDLKAVVARYETQHNLSQSTEVPYTIEAFKESYASQFGANNPHGILSSKVYENLTFQTVFKSPNEHTKAVLKQAGFDDLNGGYVINQDERSVTKVNARSIRSLLNQYGKLSEVTVPEPAAANNVDVLADVRARLTMQSTRESQALPKTETSVSVQCAMYPPAAGESSQGEKSTFDIH